MILLQRLTNIVTIADTKVCECNQGVEDSHQFFFECTIHFKDIRKLVSRGRTEDMEKSGM